MIPTLIVPILTQPELLDKMLASLDYPIDRVIIIDNGGVVDPLLGGHRMTPYRVTVLKPGHNLGVSASWNLGIKCSPLSDYWLIVNHDIEFGHGDLAGLLAVQSRAGALYKFTGLAAFAITPAVIETVGLFDEGIYPAYNEDVDYERRCYLAGIQFIDLPFTGSHVGSATIYSDDRLFSQNGMTHGMNDTYYSKKWGGMKQGGEQYDTPWNRGDLRDWHYDLERVRRQSWKLRGSE